MRMAGLDTILETTAAERPATGFVFTEGPLWHPDGYYYFADVRSSVFHRLRLGQQPEPVRTGTGEGNGTTFDLQGRLVICEGGNRRVTRWSDDRHSEVVMDRYEGKRINLRRPRSGRLEGRSVLKHEVELLMALRNFPHPEEAAERLSRRTHGANPAQSVRGRNS